MTKAPVKKKKAVSNKRKLPTTMIEPASPRGLVPTASAGIKDEPYNAYLATLDPLGESSNSESLRLALACSNDLRFNQFLERLNEPRYRRMSLATVAKTCDISLPQFAEFYQKARLQIALARAQEALPALVPDMVYDARTKEVCCERCDGFGWAYADDNLTVEFVPTIRPMSDRMIRACPACAGKGTVPKSGDTDSRKMLLEMTGMVGKKSGAAVQITQNFGGASMESAVDKMSQITFEVEAEE